MSRIDGETEAWFRSIERLCFDIKKTAERIAASLQGRAALDPELERLADSLQMQSSSTAATCICKDGMPIFVAGKEYHSLGCPALPLSVGTAATAEHCRLETDASALPWCYTHHRHPSACEAEIVEAEHAELLTLRQKNARLTSAIEWALGGRLHPMHHAELRSLAGMDAQAEGSREER